LQIRCGPGRRQAFSILGAIDHQESGNDGEAQMLGRKTAKGNPEIKPNTVIWCQILKAWKKSDSQDAPAQADAVLQRMRDQGVNPDRLVFNSLIHVHALKGNTNRSEDLLRQMLEEYENGNERVKPVTISCNMVLLSYMKASERDDAERAEQFLDLMRQGTYQTRSRLCDSTQ
jgi:pentatricopeptide repeat protein